MQLLDCFDALLAVGHSLLVVEHNLQMMKAADYIIDLGPGAADEGGQRGGQGHAGDGRPQRRLGHGRVLAKVLARAAGRKLEMIKVGLHDKSEAAFSIVIGFQRVSPKESTAKTRRSENAK